MASNSSSAITRCCTCLLVGESSDFRQTRERIGLQVRSFVDEAGLAERFPDLNLEDEGTAALVLCKRAGCLLQLCEKHRSAQSREGSRRKDNGKLRHARI